jgi:hypothetical protein
LSAAGGRAWHILGIVVLSMAIAVAILGLLLLAAFGAYGSGYGSDRNWAAGMAVLLLAVAGGGVAGIVALARRLTSEAGGGPVARAPLLTEQQSAWLLRALHVSVGVAILASVASAAARWASAAEGLQRLPLGIGALVLYQAPLLAVLYLTRSRPERPGVALALCYCGASTLQSLWFWFTILRYWRDFQLPWSYLLSVVDILATAAAAWFALGLWRRGEPGERDAIWLVGSALGSVAFLALLTYLLQLAYQLTA